METKKLNITKGKWIAQPNEDGHGYEVEVIQTRLNFGKALIANEIQQGHDDGKSDAILIADTGNYYQKHPILPSELLCLYKEAIGVLKMTREKAGMKYESECNQAHWYNNNMPGVGQTIDYKPLPKKPEFLKSIDESIEKSKEILKD